MGCIQSLFRLHGPNDQTFALSNTPQSGSSRNSDFQRPPQAFLTGSESSSNQRRNEQIGYPDSGATHHVTNNPSNLLDSISLSESDIVLLGNGQGLPILSVGSTQFASPNSPHTALTLNNLLSDPDITKNLISVNKFARDSQVYFEFHPKFCLVKSKATSKVLLKGVLGKDGLYSCLLYLLLLPMVMHWTLLQFDLVLILLIVIHTPHQLAHTQTHLPHL